MILLKLFRESVVFSWGAITANKLRTFLSLLGISIGIFCIISVFTLIDFLETGISQSFSKLGNNVVYVQKWPWSFNPNNPWWEYMKRPEPDYNEFKTLEKNISSASVVAFGASSNTTLKYKKNSVEKAGFIGISYDYIEIWPMNFQEGRYFTREEISAGRQVALLGAKIADGLFKGESAVGKKMRFRGLNVEVIGVIERQGENMMGKSEDNVVLLPLNFVRNLYDIDMMNPFIMVKAKEGISNEELKGELTGLMRSIRKLKPAQKDNFALNEMSLLSEGFKGIFSIINLAGGIIGIFSIIVGAFSIANIMFVSVKERTGIIGIQKSLGAKNWFILSQFLFESVFLCLLGGGAGLALIFLCTLIAKFGLGVDMFLSLTNVIIGIGISTAVGIVSGIIPSLSASKLNPVDAIRSV